ncbi:MAG: transposase [Mariniphaga sp.]|jgi:hypothetical protein|nr:transposase [Mariniphaga sp.]
MQEYLKKEQKLVERNSYSKADPDATFMRLKEDHLQNGQLKPAYNAQISTTNQIITNYSIHQNPRDTKTLKSHLNLFKDNYGFMLQEVIADAGYGSEENYEFMEQNNIQEYAKYNYFDQKLKSNSHTRSPFHVDNLNYDKQTNSCIRPSGDPMIFIGTKVETTDTGYPRIL